MVWLVVPRDKYVIVLDFGRHVTRRVHSDETPKGIYSALMKTHKTTHLSRTVSTCVFESDDPEVVGTAIFCQMINAFFYCTNVYGQEQNISSRRTNPSPIPLLMTSSLYGCRKPS